MGKQQGTFTDVRDLCRIHLGDLREKRFFIYLALLLFFCGASASLFARDLAVTLLDFFTESVRPRIIDRSFFSLVLFIFTHNGVALFLMIFMGMIFSIFPVVALFINGFILGAALLYSPLTWWQVLPHGVFEVPAMLLAAAYGIWLGLWPLGRGKSDGLRSRLRTCSCAYIRLILPLLVLAGFIEAALIGYVR